MSRLHVALSLYLFALLGIFLVAVPWTPMWDHLAVALLPAALADWARQGWMKGAVSGLGALDLFVAARDAGVLWRGMGARGRNDGS